MTVRSRMRHRTTIERDSSSGGQYDVPTMSAVASDQPCFLWTRSGREAVGPDRIAVVESMRVLLPLGTDVKPTDRLGDIEDRLGDTILSGPLNILSVLPHHDHVELELSRASGGA